MYHVPKLNERVCYSYHYTQTYNLNILMQTIQIFYSIILYFNNIYISIVTINF